MSKLYNKLLTINNSKNLFIVIVTTINSSFVHIISALLPNFLKLNHKILSLLMPPCKQHINKQINKYQQLDLIKYLTANTISNNKHRKRPRILTRTKHRTYCSGNTYAPPSRLANPLKRWKKKLINKQVKRPLLPRGKAQPGYLSKFLAYIKRIIRIFTSP